MATLPRGFFARDADLVARDLLGLVLERRRGEDAAAVRIAETEAYFGAPGSNPGLARRRGAHLRDVRRGDAASHAYRGETPRNRPMWGPPGRAYVYLVYGTNFCVNVVTGTAGDPQAVLVRAGEPIRGVDAMRRRRPGVGDADLARGPGNLCRALGIDGSLDGADLRRSPLRVLDAPRSVRFERTTRIGVSKARTAPLRYFDPASGCVSRT